MMQQAILIRLRPTGPWRYGPGDGGQSRVDTMFRSDRLYSAVTLAMRQLGFLDEWLDATARSASPAVTFGSLFPYQAETLFATPPATLWPPSASSVAAPSPVFLSKIRWKAARFVPLTVIEAIATGRTILADQWIADPESGCLLRRDRPNSSPFRVVVRTSAAVDRVTRAAVRPEHSACVEFEPGSGLWTVARFSDEAAASSWSGRVKGAFRLLADGGFGGRRTSGWGKAEPPEFQQGSWPALLVPGFRGRSRNGKQGADGQANGAQYWLLSLYSPSAEDSVDWSAGFYTPTVRGGRVESAAGAGIEKKPVRMIAEGSVVAAGREPIGAAVDVAPDGFAHAVYRSGIALALRLPEIDLAVDQGPVEAPTEEDLEPRPCDEPKVETALQELPSVPEEVQPEPESADEVPEIAKVDQTRIEEAPTETDGPEEPDFEI